MVAKKLIATLSLLLAMTQISACSVSTDQLVFNHNNGVSVSNNDNYKKPVVTRSYTDLAAFEGIEASVGFKVNYTVSSKRSVTVEVSEIAAKYVKVKVVNDILTLTIDNSDDSDVNLTNIRLMANVSGPALKSIEVSSGADINVLSEMSDTDGQLLLSASSGGDIDLKYPVAYSKLIVDASSGSDIDVSSVKAGFVTVDASSGSSVEISGINASKVTTDASSGSKVELAGNASNVSFDASSASKIDASDLEAQDGVADASSVARIDCNVRNLSHDSSSGGRVKNKY